MINVTALAGDHAAARRLTLPSLAGGPKFRPVDLRLQLTVEKNSADLTSDLPAAFAQMLEQIKGSKEKLAKAKLLQPSGRRKTKVGSATRFLKSTFKFEGVEVEATSLIPRSESWWTVEELHTAPISGRFGAKPAVICAEWAAWAWPRAHPPMMLRWRAARCLN